MNKFLLLALSTAVLVSSCKKDKDEDVTTPSTGNPALDAAKVNAVHNHGVIVHASYSDALAGAEALKDAIDAFATAPSESGFTACKDAWKIARISYGQTEVYRFSDGPIDDANGPEGLINAWPMDEVYVDYVVGDANAGIINSTDPAYATINGELLESLNEAGGEANISTGYHAIEFLLWGQDLSASTAGVRAYTDYTTAPNADRRKAYLQACAGLLVDHLQYLVDAWAPGSSSNYRHSFETGNVNDALTAMLQGMGFLSKGELAGERMEVAYDSQLQEDEHSCFSDNTHIDIQMNALGIRNVYLGSYTRTSGEVLDGAGLDEVLAIANSGVGTSTTTAINSATALTLLIDPPFDQQILASNLSGRETVHNAIVGLKAAGDQIAVAASTLGLNITVE